MNSKIFFFFLEKKDEEEEEEEEENTEEEKNSKVHAMVTVFHFIMKQSYVCALIAMMVSKKIQQSLFANVPLGNKELCGSNMF